jgi:hypothetical protein
MDIIDYFSESYWHETVQEIDGNSPYMITPNTNPNEKQKPEMIGLVCPFTFRRQCVALTGHRVESDFQLTTLFFRQWFKVLYVQSHARRSHAEHYSELTKQTRYLRRPRHLLNVREIQLNVREIQGQTLNTGTDYHTRKCY